VSPRWLARRTWRRLRQGKAAFAMLALAFAAVATLAAGARALAHHSALRAAGLAEQAHVVAYLEPGWGGDRRNALRTALLRLPGVREVRETDGAGALLHLRRELEALGQEIGPLASVEPDFLPASMEIVLHPGPDLARRARDTALRLQRQSGIAAVDAMAEGLDRADGFAALFDRLARIVGAVAFLAALTLMGSVLFAERRRRRGEAETLSLIGATPLALHLPAGSLAGLAALLGAAAGLPLGSRGSGYLLGVPSAWPVPPGETLLAMAAITLAGLVVGWLSVPRPREPAT
jgi:cell division protein FtsX